MGLRINLRLIIWTGISSLIVSAVLSVWVVRTMRYNSERSLLTVSVLEHNYALSQQISDLLIEISSGAPANNADGGHDVDELVASIRERLRDTRNGIAAELIAAPLENEQAELHRLAEISDQINTLVDRLERMRAETGEMSQGSVSVLMSGLEIRALRRLLHEAIADEKEEIELSRAKQASFSKRAQMFTFLGLLPLAGSFVAGFILLMRYEAYFALVLQRIEEIRTGDYGGTIPAQKETALNKLSEQIHTFTGFLQKDSHAKQSERAAFEAKLREQASEIDGLKGALARKEQVRRDLFADVSHELRTPITVIQGEAEVCLRSTNPTLDEYRLSLERICEQALLSGRIVNDLLMIARADAHALRLKLEQCNLSQLLFKTLQSFNNFISSNSISVEVNLTELEMVQLVDVRRMGQAFSILLDNAIRYMPAKGKMTISGSADSSSIEILIENTVDKGIEIDFSRVFERFYRGESADGMRRGSGLGLPVAKAIIESHNGNLEVTETKRNTVQACITLPVSENLREDR